MCLITDAGTIRRLFIGGIMKRNIDDFDGMKDFIISIITVVAWVLIGVIVTIGYFTIETKGESVILSFVSTIFTIISSLGIAATIGVYFWQRNDTKKRQNEYDKNFFSDIKSAAEEFIDASKRYKNAFETILKNYDKTRDNIIKLKSYSTLIIKVERGAALKNLAFVTNCEPTLNLEKTRMDPALLSNEKYIFYNEAKSTLKEVDNFIKGFILDNENSLPVHIPFDDKMIFYIKNKYCEHITKLEKIVNTD